jgi:hypothetical protein
LNEINFFYNNTINVFKKITKIEVDYLDLLLIYFFFYKNYTNFIVTSFIFDIPKTTLRNYFFLITDILCAFSKNYVKIPDSEILRKNSYLNFKTFNG